jgi:hypothetical protein
MSDFWGLTILLGIVGGMALFASWVWRNPKHYPRPRVLYVIQHTLEQWGLAKPVDMFGMMWPKDRLPPDPLPPVYVVTQEELTEQRQETVTQQPPKKESVFGG